MQCYSELLPPSGVTNVLSVPFVSATSNNLLVAKTSLLQVFSLVNVPYGAAPNQQDEKARVERPQHTKLVLVAEYDVPGIITALGRVKLLDCKSGGEAVLVAIRDAKLSLIEWDPEKHGISTTSIHYYEREDEYNSPWHPDLKTCPSHLTVDPSSRCAILNFGIRNLAILPFHQQGDDLVMDDYDSELDGERPEVTTNGTNGSTDVNDSAHQTPYMSSFVLPLPALDPSLTHPISLEFLHEYREPTFGILYSQGATSSALLHERKDVVSYAVFTLDLQQRASTTLLSVPRLPSDLFKIVPLPPPVGGALLIGSNELVHVDQGGKTNAVGVNEFARQASIFSMADQADLEMRLEGCVVEQLGADNGDMALLLSDGRMAVINFKLDGRSVSGISVTRISEKAGGSILKARPSCSAALGRARFFIGSEEGDSLLLGWSRPSSSTKKIHGSPNASEDGVLGLSDVDEDEDEEDDLYEDDLYSTPMDSTALQRQNSTAVNGEGLNEYIFRPHDRLWNLGLMRDITLGRPPAPRSKQKSSVPSPALDLVATQGSGRAGGLAILRREVDPFVIDSLKIEGAEGIWSIQVRDTKNKGPSAAAQPRIFDRYLILGKSKDPDQEESVVYSVSDKGLEEIKAPEFNPNEDATIDVGTLANGTRAIQVLKTEVRSYDNDLGLAQIYPVWDEDTSEERTVSRASFAEPYLLIIRDDQSLLILQADESGDLDEISLGETITSRSWLSGSLYVDKSHHFTPQNKDADEKTSDNVLLFLLDTDLRLLIFRLPDTTQPIFTLEGVDLLPPILSPEPPPKRQTHREMIQEILITDLGDYISRSPYLILRTMDDDLIVYEPYRRRSPAGDSDIRFLKAANHFFNKPPSESDQNMDEAGNGLQFKPLRALEDVCGYKTVFMPGTSPCFILKSSISRPHVLGLRGKAVHGLSSFHIPACERGFAYVDAENVVRMSRFPANTRFDNLWSTRKIVLGEEVDCVEYSAPSATYVLGTSQKADFKLPDDDEVHTEWRSEDISFMPQLERGTVKLLDPRSWSIIDSHPLSPAERIMSIKTMSLEISEVTHEQKDLTVVGTAIVRGEDINPRGCIYVFEVIDVVPELDKAETNHKLKLIAKEEVKGPVTSVSAIGGQGFLIAAQGQKCMVRGLKEDCSLLPVAFMDMQCYVNVLKELKGTGMCIMGDALKGLWFTGYSEEPYKLTLFGKESESLQVMAADFLPDGRKLYILVADDGCNIHVMEYDPEDPSSSKGDRLLRRSVFHTGHFASTLTLLPRAATSSSASNDDQMDTGESPLGYQALVTSQDGSLALVTPMVEESYRRLSALQSQLVTTLEHPCGLNPRMYRAVESDGIGGRGMLDGNLLQRWLDLGAQRKAEIASRVGADTWEVRGDLEDLGMGGLAYF